MAIVNTGDFNFNDGHFAKAISLYADAARTDNALMLSTGIVGADARISDSGEGYTGILRWLSYSDGADITKPVTNTPLGANFSEFMDLSNQQEVYVKNVDATGAQENSLQSLISRVDGLSYLGRQFGASRARKEDANLRSVIAGVVASLYAVKTEADVDTADSATYGATVIGPANPSGLLGTSVSRKFGYRLAYRAASGDIEAGFTPLFENDAAGTPLGARSSFFDGLLDAMAHVQQEFEAPFYYLAINAETYNVLRKQNVMDAAPVQDGNISFSTILGGKIRLLVTGNVNMPVPAGLQTGLTASVLMTPAALHYSNVAINNPTAIDTNVVTNRGFGDVTILSRWGNIIHPKGWSFAGNGAEFPTNSTLATAGTWTIQANNVNQTGIFPIFHG